MTEERDELFKAPPFGPSEFRFDENVARVFSDMLRRSIPGYATLLGLIGTATRRFAMEDTTLYDLGASLGAVTLTMRHALEARDARIVAVDNSRAMVERCRSLLESDSALAEATVVEADVTDFPLERASLVVLNFTLQFVPESEREALVARIYDALVPGGALIISEKVLPSSPEEAILPELHDEFRASNGYSHLELARKRASLEKVLLPETREAHVARLRRAGFSVTPFFSALNFASFLAVRKS